MIRDAPIPFFQDWAQVRILSYKYSLIPIIDTTFGSCDLLLGLRQQPDCVCVCTVQKCHPQDSEGRGRHHALKHDYSSHRQYYWSDKCPGNCTSLTYLKACPHSLCRCAGQMLVFSLSSTSVNGLADSSSSLTPDLSFAAWRWRYLHTASVCFYISRSTLQKHSIGTDTSIGICATLVI